MRRNVDVLMDRAPADAEEAARLAIAGIQPPVSLRRLRIRSAAGHHFADVVIEVSPGAAVGQGHAAADLVEEAIQRALPETDVVVHVEPGQEDAITRELAQAAAMRIPRVREIHNIAVLHVDGRTEVSLHLKLPGDLELDRAHEIAEQVEAAIRGDVREVRSVQTHIEPLKETSAGEEIDIDTEAIEAAVREETGTEPRELRFVRTDDGIVAFLTLGLGSPGSVADAHVRATAIEERVRRAVPAIADVVVHTEP
jgi:divalent metal cation (Fe/Co/Zn/Cd) transporter